MNLSVIIPIFNEEKTIGIVLKELLLVAAVKQIIVVDDGSTDKSVKEVQKIKSKKIVLVKKENGGKGSAIRLGLKKVTQKYVLIQDADLEYHPEDIKVLIDPIRKRPNVLVVYGSRFLGSRSNLLYWHMLGNKLLNFFVNILFDTTLSDLETCYKLIPTQLMKELDLSSDGFDIEVEITCQLLKKGVRIYEVPISYFGRDFRAGKKITWKDGLTAIVAILKYRVQS
ncbi:MAG: glycosyltransferase family 2 protein [Patescibacteria group bacterium]